VLCCWGPRLCCVSLTEDVVLVWRGGSALRAGSVARLTAAFRAVARAYFLLLRQKKVAKEKATPGSAPGVARSLALLGRPGGLQNSPAAQTDASRMPPALLRCSAPLRGTRKASRNNGSALEKQKGCFLAVDRWKMAKTILSGSAATSFRVPMWSAEQRRRAGGLRRGLSEARRAEFRSRPALRVAQGSRRSRPRSLGSPFLCLLSFGEAKESETPRKGGTQPPSKDENFP